MPTRVIQLVVAALVLVALSACGQTDAGGSAGSKGHATGTQAAGGEVETATGMQYDGTQSSAAPFDAQFIDSMIEHHRGAITMAQQALKESQRPEIKQLAQNIITTQQQEIDQMAGWRTQWYPDVQPTGGTGMAMGDMEVNADTSMPFDQRFITAMVAHHEGAIAMAREAQTKAEHPEIKQLAEAIIKAQEAEVAQLKTWQEQWFGG